MMLLIRVSAFITAFACISSALAGTVIEHRAAGRPATTLIEGDKVRINNSAQNNYLLLDLQQKRAYVVDPSRRVNLDLGNTLWQKDATGKPVAGARLLKQGGGPLVAGYATVHYQSTNGSTVCADEYLSTGPMKIPDIRRVAEQISGLATNVENIANHLSSRPRTDDPCVRARSSLGAQYLDQGIPLRTRERNGTVSHEVTRINTGVSIDHAQFALPDFPVLPLDGSVPGLSIEDLGALQRQLRGLIQRTP